MENSKKTNPEHQKKERVFKDEQKIFSTYPEEDETIVISDVLGI